MRTTTTLVALLGMMLAATAANAAKFYKWTDADGVTHYSADPPPDSVSASQVKVPTRRNYDETEPAQTTGQASVTTPGKTGVKDEKAAKKDAEKKEASNPERYAEKCKTLRTNLQTMQEHARIKIKEDNGETRILTDEEKAAQQDDIQRQIKAFCE